MERYYKVFSNILDYSLQHNGFIPIDYKEKKYKDDIIFRNFLEKYHSNEEYYIKEYMLNNSK